MSLPAFAAYARPGRVLLIVDDEAAIRQTLTTLFEKLYSVVAVESGEAALEKLKGGLKPAVILSDNRMPGISGVEFLARSIELSPDSIRAIMTGYAEIGEILMSVNKGYLFMYLSKPWQIAEVLQSVRLCFQHYDAVKLNRTLLADTEAQTVLLAKLNDELRGSNASLDSLAQKTLSDLLLTARALGILLGAQEDYYHGNHPAFVAEVCRKVGEYVGFRDDELSLVEIAAYLHDIGKAGLSRAVRAADPATLTGNDRALYESHVKRALHLFEGVRQFERVREIISQHHERADGSGFPAKIGGRQLLRESHLLALVDTYHNLVYRYAADEDRRRQSGMEVVLSGPTREARQRKATAWFEQHKALFDPRTYKAFVEVGTIGTIPEFKLLN